MVRSVRQILEDERKSKYTKSENRYTIRSVRDIIDEQKQEELVTAIRTRAYAEPQASPSQAPLRSAYTAPEREEKEEKKTSISSMAPRYSDRPTASTVQERTQLPLLSDKHVSDSVSSRYSDRPTASTVQARNSAAERNMINRQGAKESLGYGTEKTAAGLVSGITEPLRAAGSLAYKAGEAVTSWGGLAPNKLSRALGDYAKSYYDDRSILKPVDEWTSGIDERYDVTDIQRKAGALMQSGAEMLPSIAAGKAAGDIATKLTGAGKAADMAARAAQTATFTGRAIAGGTKEALSEGADFGRATVYGAAAGALEATIESIAGGIPGLDKLGAGTLTSRLINNPAIKGALDIIGEGGEEALSEVLTPYLKRAVYDRNARNATWKEIGESFISGALLSAVMNTAASIAGAGLGDDTKVWEKLNRDAHEDTKLDTPESETNLAEEMDSHLEQEKQAEETLEADELETLRKNKNLESPMDIRENSADIIERDNDIFRNDNEERRSEVFDSYNEESGNDEIRFDEPYDDNIDNYEDFRGGKQESVTEPVRRFDTEQFSPEQAEIEPGITNHMERLRREANRPRTRDEFASYREKRFTLETVLEDAKKKTVTSEEAKAFLQRTKQNRYAIGFVDNIAKRGNLDVKYYIGDDSFEGLTDGNTIYLNLASSADKIDYVLRHELIHDLKTAEGGAVYNELVDFVMKNAEAVGLDNAMEKLRDRYNKLGLETNTEVFTDELLAELGSELLTNRDVIDRLSSTKAGAAEKIYEWVFNFSKNAREIVDGKKDIARKVISSDSLFSSENIKNIKAAFKESIGKGTKTAGGFSDSGIRASVSQLEGQDAPTAAENADNIRPSPEEIEGYQEAEDNAADIDTGAEDYAPMIKDKGIGISKDILRNIDAASGGNPTVRKWLKENIIDVLNVGKDAFSRACVNHMKELHDVVVVKYGIQKGSLEDAAIMWYGEGKRQVKTKVKGEGHKNELVTYTLADLQRDFPTKWQDIVAAERYMRAKYDDFIERINKALEKIYPNIVEKTLQQLASYDAAIEHLRTELGKAENTEKAKSLRKRIDEIVKEGTFRNTKLYNLALNFLDQISMLEADIMNIADSPELLEIEESIREAILEYNGLKNKGSQRAIAIAARIENLEVRYMKASALALEMKEKALAKARTDYAQWIDQSDLRHNQQLAKATQKYERFIAEENARRDRLRASTELELRQITQKRDRLVRDIESGEVLRNKRLPKRKDYFRHISEIGNNFTITSLVSELLTNQSIQIDPELVGLSEFTQPKSKWAGFMQPRGRGEYVESAIEGLLNYIPQAEYKINIEPVIPHLRAVIRDIAQATKQTKNANQFIDYLIKYTNDLAGKTNPIDRGALNIFGDKRGRAILNGLEKLSLRPKANAIMYNIGSAIVQISNLPNLMAYIKNPVTFAQGCSDAVRMMFGAEDLRSVYDKSVFMRERYMDKMDRLFDVTILDRAETFAGDLLRWGDEAVATAGWWALYRQGIKQGRGEAGSIEYADEFTRRAIGGRGIGEVPLEQKSRLIKAIAPFQVEVRNTWNLIKERAGERDGIALLMMFLTTWLINKAILEPLGKESGVDLISACIDAGKIVADEGLSIGEKALYAPGRVAGEVVSAHPLGAYATTAIINDDETRAALFGDADPTRYGTGNIGINTIIAPLRDFAAGKNVDITGTALQFALPFGGKQAARSIDAMQAYGWLPKLNLNKDKANIELQDFAGSFTDKGNLRFGIDTADPINAVKGLMFGVFATKEGKEYLEGGRKIYSNTQTITGDMAQEIYGINATLAAKAVREMNALTSDKDEYGETVPDSLKRKQHEYIDGLDLTNEQKRGLWILTVESSGLSMSDIYDAWGHAGTSEELVEYLDAIDFEKMSATKKRKLYDYIAMIKAGAQYAEN